MSSNGVMLQDYVPDAINNLTEEIWCAGAVIPRGKRVVLGHIRDGWQEITFTMGPMQDFIGMALVPPSIVGIEPAPPHALGAMMPRGMGASYGGSSRSQIAGQCPGQRTWHVGLNSNGSNWIRQWDDPNPPPATKVVAVCVPICGTNETLSLLVGQHTHVPESDPYFLSYLIDAVAKGIRPKFYCEPKGSIDQNAPLPGASNPASPVPGGQFTAHQALIRAQREQVLFPDQSAAPRGSRPPYQWGGLHGMLPSGVASRRTLAGWGRAGLGAAGASEFTMKAAEELDEHLTTNGCAGCDDYKSTLRQLAFKFKAACMTDPGVQNQVSFNISTPLAMTAFGVGTDKALTLVLGAKRTYDGSPCTDDNGACLGNVPQITQVTPVALGPLITQVVNQISDQIQQQKAQPAATQLGRQENLVDTFMAAATGLFTALSAALANVQPVAIVKEQPKPAPAPEKKSMLSTFLIGGLIGTAVIGTGVLLYTHARRA